VPYENRVAKPTPPELQVKKTYAFLLQVSSHSDRQPAVTLRSSPKVLSALHLTDNNNRRNLVYELPKIREGNNPAACGEGDRGKMWLVDYITTL
jgi:hypothetical protein